MAKPYVVTGAHIASEPHSLIQRCARCGMILIDNQRMQAADGHGPRFFPKDAIIEKTDMSVGSISEEVCDVTLCIPTLLN